jgi:hypothetical protein
MFRTVVVSAHSIDRGRHATELPLILDQPQSKAGAIWARPAPGHFSGGPLTQPARETAVFVVLCRQAQLSRKPKRQKMPPPGSISTKDVLGDSE